MGPETKTCQNCKQNFTVEAGDFEFYKKMAVPPPTWCPECRMMRRLVFWNERFFFKKVEKRTGKELISMFPPEAPNEIYERDYWWSDAWSPLTYGREIDWSRPFLQQVRELQLEMPMPSRSIIRAINSDYSNNAADIKNCYLTFNADRSEDCLYAVGINKMKNSIGVFRAESSELMYESYAAFDSYQCFLSSIVVNCRNVWLSYDCHDCSDCFGCVNLRHKRYCIFNVEYTKEEYEKKLAEMDLGSYRALADLEKKFSEFNLRFPRRFMSGLRNVNVSGDAMRNSKNTYYSFAVNACEDVKYSQSILMGAKDSYDYTNWGNAVELTYETTSCGENVQRLKFCWDCYGGMSDAEYSMYCTGSSNLFGCIALRNQKYCILNKQYSKEEYQALLPKLRQHMLDEPYVDARGLVYKYGEFFPAEFSWFAADETAVVDFMDMTKERALSYGLTWRERKATEHKTTVLAKDLPDHIKDAVDDVIKEVIGCGQCGKGYRILPAELQFLRRFTLPLPRQCPNCRMRALIVRRNLPKWYQGACQCGGLRSTSGVYENIGKHVHGAVQCPEKFLTSYDAGRSEIVYCEGCYQKEVT